MKDSVFAEKSQVQHENHLTSFLVCAILEKEIFWEPLLIVPQNT